MVYKLSKMTFLCVTAETICPWPLWGQLLLLNPAPGFNFIQCGGGEESVLRSFLLFHKQRGKSRCRHNCCFGFSLQLGTTPPPSAPPNRQGSESGMAPLRGRPYLVLRPTKPFAPSLCSLRLVASLMQAPVYLIWVLGIIKPTSQGCVNDYWDLDEKVLWEL